MVRDSYSVGNVTGGIEVGGLVGTNYGTVNDCHSSGSVISEQDCVGGLVGENNGTVSNSYSTGSVTGGGYVGGLVGENWGTVSNSYTTGNVSSHTFAGGLVGINFYDGAVTNCYSTGSVTGDMFVGGLLGANCMDGYCGIVINSFWDTQTSGQATSAGGVGKNTMEMQDITTFSYATWNIITVANPDARNLSYIWNIVDDETYPFLSWQP
jgi:hypothetical protein